MLHTGRQRIHGTAVMSGIAVLIGLFLAFANRAQAADFIRGDANSDGRVSISDAGFLMGYFFLGSSTPECLSSADTDDSGSLNIADEVRILTVLFLGSSEISQPFPDPGPDPTADFNSCESYGSGTPLEDSAAKIAILDAVASGGSDRKVTLPIAISSSGSIAGYSFQFADTDVIDWGQNPGFRDLAPFPARDHSGFLGSSFPQDGPFRVGTMFSLSEGKEAPAGEDVVLLELVVCLEPGTPAGDYPIGLAAGELIASCLPNGVGGEVCSDMGRAVLPALVGGTVTVLEDIQENAGCNTFVPPPPPPIYISFRLSDETSVAGGNFEVPLGIKADRPSTGFSYSIRFDRDILQCTRTDQLWQKPDGTPYEFVRYEWNNEAGEAVGAAVISLSDTEEVLPSNVETVVLGIGFHVAENAPEGVTELEFEDGGQGSGGPVRNKLIAGGQEITPDLASSFVLVGARINIVPDGSPFVRGDANGDRAINISDPRFTLNALFLGGEAPRCYDAVDANDDGKLDISDAVRTLQFLFLGGTHLPPPFPAVGIDPTADELTCPSSTEGQP
jgi:hypothetical protein